MEARAVARFMRVPPRKVGLVAELIRGKKIGEALNVLAFTPKAAARVVAKVLKSAVANAQQSQKIDVDTLYVKRVEVGPGPSLKRIQPVAFGRAHRVLKRSSHITVVLDEE
ncbi:MAG: 50S ribosomal protein L22 [Deltaproteobacteria bacterium]|nr:50S ribosomal protein L22 [Deltaproteobacteria bacterium]